MKTESVSIVMQVNKERVTDDSETITIHGVVPIVDDIVMNGGWYPAEDIAKTYNSLEGTIAPSGHPKDSDGNFISATEGEALHKYYIGAYNRNVSYKDGKVELDVVINKAQMMAHPDGEELQRRIDNPDSGPIHVSTGLLLQREKIAGNIKGKDYTWKAHIIKFDHNAILLHEKGAGQPDQGVGMWTNAEKTQFVVNHNPEQPTFKEKVSAIVLDMLANCSPTGYNNAQAQIVPNNDPHEVLEMNEEEVKALLQANSDALTEKFDALLQANSDELKSTKEEIETLKIGIAANAASEKDVLVKQVAEKLGMEANMLQGMEVEGLKALMAKGKTIAQVNSGGEQKAEAYYTAEDLEAK